MKIQGHIKTIKVGEDSDVLAIGKSSKSFTDVMVGSGKSFANIKVYQTNNIKEMLEPVKAEWDTSLESTDIYYNDMNLRRYMGLYCIIELS